MWWSWQWGRILISYLLNDARAASAVLLVVMRGRKQIAEDEYEIRLILNLILPQSLGCIELFVGDSNHLMRIIVLELGDS